MTGATCLSRRALFAATIGVGVAQLVECATGLAAAQHHHATDAEARLITACLSLDCTESIQNACERALSEASAVRLVALILDDLIAAGRDCSSIAAIRRALRFQSRKDFAKGEVIEVEGWLLSLTEVRAYALCAPTARSVSRL
jgi:hypothetical protein